MMRRKLTRYLSGTKERKDLNRELVKKLKKIADKYTIQYALLWYIYLVKEASLKELYKVYSYLSDKLVRENTVRKQLQMLERKELVRRVGDKYYCLVIPSEVEDLFDVERSRSGKIGAIIKHMKLSSKSLKLSPGLAYYTKTVIEKAKKLVIRGKRAEALDLIVHTLLPLRKNATLWLWYGDLFVYYDPKTRQKWRAVRSREIAELLKKLGFSEGIMIIHTLGHREASKIIHRIFSRGPHSWPWSRSISYGLKYLGLLKETTNFKIQLKRIDNKIGLTLWDLYTKEEICNYNINWNHEIPEPLKNRNHVVATVLGKQHVKREIEMDSYINSKWR